MIANQIQRYSFVALTASSLVMILGALGVDTKTVPVTLEAQ
jgi:hypothetical protein